MSKRVNLVMGSMAGAVAIHVVMMACSSPPTGTVAPPGSDGGVLDAMLDALGDTMSDVVSAETGSAEAGGLDAGAGCSCSTLESANDAQQIHNVATRAWLNSLTNLCRTVYGAPSGTGHGPFAVVISNDDSSVTTGAQACQRAQAFNTSFLASTGYGGNCLGLLVDRAAVQSLPSGTSQVQVGVVFDPTFSCSRALDRTISHDQWASESHAGYFACCD